MFVVGAQTALLTLESKCSSPEQPLDTFNSDSGRYVSTLRSNSQCQNVNSIQRIVGELSAQTGFPANFQSTGGFPERFSFALT